MAPGSVTTATFEIACKVAGWICSLVLVIRDTDGADIYGLSTDVDANSENAGIKLVSDKLNFIFF